MKRGPFWQHFHPFLFGFYPVIAMLGHNIDQMRPLDALRSLLIMGGITSILMLFLWWIFRDWTRASIVTSLVFFFFLIYENSYHLVEDATLFSISIGRQGLLMPIFGLGMLLILLWIHKNNHNLAPIAQIFSLVGLVAVFFPLYQISSFEISDRMSIVSGEIPAGDSRLKFNRDAYPDIYFIVLDAYARGDMLAKHFNYDNSSFLVKLKKLGFYLPMCSQSNYSKTSYSISSSLNLNYLQVLAGDIRTANANKDFIRDNAVRIFLEERGYKTVAFPTGFVWSEIDTADIYLTPEKNDIQLLGPWSPLATINPFVSLLMQSSFGTIVDLLMVSGIDIFSEVNGENLERKIKIDGYREIYNRVHFGLDALEKIPYIPGPKFVYGHIVSPHSPYVFDQHGNFSLNEDNPVFGYTQQVTYLNDRILRIVQTILEVSKTPPIIIILGNHGAKEVEWTPEIIYNLSAYYFPDEGDQLLYHTVTPVNAVRLMLDYYFGTGLGLVEDISYNSLSEETPWEVSIVPNACPQSSVP